MPSTISDDDAEAIAIPWEGDPLAGLWLEPRGAKWLYVFAHGAGAGMRHPFMATMAAALAERGIATLRWEQPAMTRGGRRPDRPAAVETMARAACEHARALRRRRASRPAASRWAGA
ncbi:MAG: alpha/beta family hydrolase [Myxococcota bacterium]